MQYHTTSYNYNFSGGKVIGWMQDDAQGRNSKIQPLEPAFSSGKTSTEQLWVSTPPVIFGVTEFMTYKTPKLHRMFAIPDMFSRFPQWNLWPYGPAQASCTWQPKLGSTLKAQFCHSQWWHPLKFPEASSCQLTRHTNIEKVS